MALSTSGSSSQLEKFESAFSITLLVRRLAVLWTSVSATLLTRVAVLCIASLARTCKWWDTVNPWKHSSWYLLMRKLTLADAAAFLKKASNPVERPDWLMATKQIFHKTTEMTRNTLSIGILKPYRYAPPAKTAMLDGCSEPNAVGQGYQGQSKRCAAMMMRQVSLRPRLVCSLHCFLRRPPTGLKSKNRNEVSHLCSRRMPRCLICVCLLGTQHPSSEAVF